MLDQEFPNFVVPWSTLFPGCYIPGDDGDFSSSDE